MKRQYTLTTSTNNQKLIYTPNLFLLLPNNLWSLQNLTPGVYLLDVIVTEFSFDMAAIILGDDGKYFFCISLERIVLSINFRDSIFFVQILYNFL
jgi:hypothetical protein